MTPPPTRLHGLVDTHAHLADPDLSADLPGLLSRARESSVDQVIAVGTTADDSLFVQQLAGRTPGIFATVGVHPNHAQEAQPGDWERVQQLAAHPKVVAIGETGLDRYWDKTPFDQQQEWFDRHLALGFERDLPVVIHCREAERDVIGQLAALRRPVRGVLHSFAGSWEDAQALLELGLYLSLAGMVTFANKSLDALRATAARIPIDRLMVETDSPYLSPHPFRGRTNEPSRVATTAERIAALRGLDVDEFARHTTDNARRLFALPADERL